MLKGVLDKIDKPLECLESNSKNIKENRSNKQLIVTNKKTFNYNENLKDYENLEVTGKFHGSCCLIAVFSEVLRDQMINDKTLTFKNDNIYSFNINYKKSNISIELEIGKKYLWRRRDVKKGRKIPNGWLRTSESKVNHNIGYILVTEYETEAPYINIMNKTNILRNLNNNFFIEEQHLNLFEEGTYELCGPNMQNNVHKFNVNLLIPHGIYKINNTIFNSFYEKGEDVDLDKIRLWLLNDKEGKLFEGIVIHITKNKKKTFYKLHRGHLGLGKFIDAPQFLYK